jgi:phosphate acetyltransferase
VAGNISSTEDSLRPALKIIGSAENYASSYFLKIFKDKTLFFADCGFNREPSAEELAKIAVDTAKSVKEYGLEPRVAFLSFSTKESAKHPRVDKVRAAIALAQAAAPDIAISEDELQFDAAVDPEVALRKAPGSRVAGNANVLIFPDLDSGNIGYKIAHRMAGARPIGPIMQGLNAPANDLSRGCSVQEIIDVVAVTAMQAGERKKKQN